jgi:hypothetical protein
MQVNFFLNFINEKISLAKAIFGLSYHILIVNLSDLRLIDYLPNYYTMIFNSIDQQSFILVKNLFINISLLFLYFFNLIPFLICIFLKYINNTISRCNQSITAFITTYSLERLICFLSIYRFIFSYIPRFHNPLLCFCAVTSNRDKLIFTSFNY